MHCICFQNLTKKGKNVAYFQNADSISLAASRMLYEDFAKKQNK